MKSLIVSGIIAFAVGLCIPQIAKSQGTTYLSSLGSSVTAEEVASDSWLAADIFTGNNPGGYMLDSIQLELTSPSGTPNGFTVQLYTLTDGTGFPLPHEPGISLASLSGTTDPPSAGTYTYIASDVTLAPNTDYAVVVTAETSIATGSFSWGLEGPSSNTSSDGWTEGGVTFEASDGSSWTEISGDDPQLAVMATAVPEPGTLGLLVFGGLILAWHCWQAKEAPRLG
jgi:hypothetical protein